MDCFVFISVRQHCLHDEIVEAVDRFIFDFFRERHHDSEEEKLGERWNAFESRNSLRECVERVHQVRAAIELCRVNLLHSLLSDDFRHRQLLERLQATTKHVRLVADFIDGVRQIVELLQALVDSELLVVVDVVRLGIVRRIGSHDVQFVIK